MFEFAGVEIYKTTSGTASFVTAHSQTQIELRKPIIVLILPVFCLVFYQLLQVRALVSLLNLVCGVCEDFHLQLEVLFLDLFYLIALLLLFRLFLLSWLFLYRILVPVKLQTSPMLRVKFHLDSELFQKVAC